MEENNAQRVSRSYIYRAGQAVVILLRNAPKGKRATLARVLSHLMWPASLKDKLSSNASAIAAAAREIEPSLSDVAVEYNIPGDWRSGVRGFYRAASTEDAQVYAYAKQRAIEERSNAAQPFLNSVKNLLPEGDWHPELFIKAITDGTK